MNYPTAFDDSDNNNNNSLNHDGNNGANGLPNEVLNNNKVNNVNGNNNKGNNNIEEMNKNQPASQTLTENILKSLNGNDPVGLTTGQHLYDASENMVPGSDLENKLKPLKINLVPKVWIILWDQVLEDMKDITLMMKNKQLKDYNIFMQKNERNN